MLLRLPFLLSLRRKGGFQELGGTFFQEEGMCEDRIQGEERRERPLLNCGKWSCVGIQLR